MEHGCDIGNPNDFFSLIVRIANECVSFGYCIFGDDETVFFFVFNALGCSFRLFVCLFVLHFVFVSVSAC